METWLKRKGNLPFESGRYVLFLFSQDLRKTEDAFILISSFKAHVIEDVERKLLNESFRKRVFFLSKAACTPLFYFLQDVRKRADTFIFNFKFQSSCNGRGWKKTIERKLEKKRILPFESGRYTSFLFFARHLKKSKWVTRMVSANTCGIKNLNWNPPSFPSFSLWQTILSNSMILPGEEVSLPFQSFSRRQTCIVRL